MQFVIRLTVIPKSNNSFLKEKYLILHLQPLLDRLESYAEDPSLANPRKAPGAQPFISLPPDFEPIAAKPVFFDLANNHIDFPSLDDLAEPSASAAQGGGGITGFVKGWMGWGNKK